MSKKLTVEQEKLLSNIYYKQKQYVGRDKLFELVKNKENHPTQVQVSSWLKDQEVNQLHRKPKRSSAIAPIIIKKPDIYYQADLIDMGEAGSSFGKRYILTLIDAFTKQAFAQPMKNKNENSVLKGFKEIYGRVTKQGKKIKVLQTDNGSEFVDKEFKKFLKEKDIRHVLSLAGRPMSNGFIERFNGTLKDYIQKDITATGKNQWAKNLHTYIDNYNNSYHSTIKMTPNEAASKTESVYNNIEKVATKSNKVKKNKLKVGDRVRIKIFKGKLEKYSTQNFSKAIYTIHKIIVSEKPFIQNKYRLKNKDGEVVKNFYTDNDLLKVTHVFKSPVRILKVEKPKVYNSKTAKKEVTKSSIQTRKKKIDFKQLVGKKVKKDNN